MAVNTLKQFTKEIGDAIRYKGGGSDLINPQDFASRIRALPIGQTIIIGEADLTTGDKLKLFGAETYGTAKLTVRASATPQQGAQQLIIDFYVGDGAGNSLDWMAMAPDFDEIVETEGTFIITKSKDGRVDVVADMSAGMGSWSESSTTTITLPNNCYFSVSYDGTLLSQDGICTYEIETMII